MLSLQDIVEAVKDCLEGRFPKAKVYTDEVPKGFVRPSFLVQLGTVEMSDASYACLELEVEVSVLIFTKLDHYANCKAAELIPVMAGVQELFAVSGLRVGDGEAARTLHVLAVRGEPQLDYAQVSVTLSYQDDRPTRGEWPLMGEVELAMVAE